MNMFYILGRKPLFLLSNFSSLYTISWIKYFSAVNFNQEVLLRTRSVLYICMFTVHVGAVHFMIIKRVYMYLYVYVYIYIYVCVCICIYINKGRVYLGIKCSMLW